VSKKITPLTLMVPMLTGAQLIQEISEKEPELFAPPYGWKSLAQPIEMEKGEDGVWRPKEDEDA
jgi:hypothetical protein